jgi:transglutaminase-like putative cysteine protease
MAARREEGDVVIRRRAIPWWAEIPLVTVSVATAVSFIRVYDSWDFLGPLLAFALGAHVLAIACRRLRLPAPLVVVLAIGGAAVAAGLILFPSTTAFGLPTSATWTAASDALHTARVQYPVVIAPTAVLPGFQLAAGVALWLAAWFGDWAGHRLRATAEAVAATTAIFVFCSVLGSGDDAIACAAAFAAAVLGFVAVQRSLAIERDQAWLPTHRTTSRAVLRSAGAIALVALVAGVLIGPSLPGARSEAAVEWRGGGAGDRSRVTVSPMVEIRTRLVDQSNREVFRVRASEPAYWRLTSLDAFDGEIWSSSGEFKEAGGELPRSASKGQASRSIRQQVTIEALSAIWAPTAFEAVSVNETETPLRWDPDSSTLIVDSSEPTSDGLTYSVVSQVPEFGAQQLDDVRGPDPKAIRDRYLGLPSDFPFLASDTARQVTAAADTRYDKAIALQDFFREEFRYSLEPEIGHGDSAIEQFLQSGEGYCEQFAGTFAAMARSLGIPARVAVGFTPGNASKDDPNLYRVYGRHAHAWPEVYFPNVGWVAFEPTPGRGMPGAEQYTGVKPEQDLAEPVTISTTSTTAVATTAAPSSEEQPEATRPPRTEQTEAGAAEAPAESGGSTSTWRIVVLVALAVIGGAVAFARRRRRAHQRLAALSPADRAWLQVSERLAGRAAVVPDPAETPFEFVERARPIVGGAVAEDLAELADLVTEARWSPHGVSPEGQRRIEPLTTGIIDALDHPSPVPA